MSFQRIVPDVPVVIPQISPQVETSTAQAIQAAGALAGDVVLGVQKKRASESIRNLSETVTAIEGTVAAHTAQGRSAFDPQGGLITEGLDADLQRQVASAQSKAAREFGLIAESVRQGAVPQEAAALQADAAISRLVRQTPGFSKEIKSLARELLGYDPSGYAIRKTLGLGVQREKPQTAAEKQWEQAVLMSQGLAVAGINVSPETIFGGLSVQNFNAMTKANADAALEMGTMAFDQWYNTYSVERGVDMGATIANLVEVQRQEGLEGAERNPQRYLNAVIEQREAEKREVALRARDSNASRGAIDSAYADIDKRYQPILDLVADNSYLSIMGNHWEEIGLMYKLAGNEALPWLTEVLTAFPNVAPEVFGVISNISDPSQINLLYPKGSPIREVLDTYGLTGNPRRLTRAVTGVLKKLQDGAELTEEERALLPLIDSQVLSTSGSSRGAQPARGGAVTRKPDEDTLRSEYLRSLAEAGAPIRAASILGRKVPMVAANQKERDFFKAQYDIAIGTPATEELPGNLIMAAARELSERTGILEGGLQLDSAGRLYVPVRATTSGITTNLRTPALEKLQVYLDAVNQNGWGRAFGVDRETFGESLISRVESRAAALREAQAEQEKRDKVFGWNRGAAAATSWGVGGAGALDTSQPSRSVTDFQNFLGTPQDKPVPGSGALGSPPGKLETYEGMAANNPFNMKDFGIPWEGVVASVDGPGGGKYLVFKAPEYGARAAARNLNTIFTGAARSTGGEPKTSVEDIVSTWAPPGEENPNLENYINHVARVAGVGRNQKMTVEEFRAKLPLILTAMARFETGKDIPIEVVLKGIELAGWRDR